MVMSKNVNIAFNFFFYFSSSKSSIQTEKNRVYHFKLFLNTDKENYILKRIVSCFHGHQAIRQSKEQMMFYTAR